VKLASIEVGGEVRLALAIDDKKLLVPSLTGEGTDLASLPASVRGLLEMPGGLERLRQLAGDIVLDAERLEAFGAKGALVDVAGAVFQAPVPNPVHFMGAGVSYQQHLKEMGETWLPENPVLFLCSPNALAGHLQRITIPPAQPEMLDYEGELAIVIGKSCYNVSVEEAMNYVAGYTIHNDLSPRDHVSEVKAVVEPTRMLDAWGRNVAAKQHPTLSPMGPFLVTVDQAPNPLAMNLETKVNGEVVQSTGIDDLLFTVAHYVSYVSKWYCLLPGDLISTGTPGGVGIAQQPPRFLHAGDIVEVSITGLGTLSNIIGES
jgi:2-keto-4-pentenoate hydratase/2-oxohepta-3-ene-1,7-dioic acid hydratase in catechol pathway